MRWPSLWKLHTPEEPWNDEQSVRAELFGLERFKAHAVSLAESQVLSDDPGRVHTVVARLHENADVLLDSYRELSAAATAGKAITPAAEWLIDNYYLIEGHIGQAVDDLPSGYYRQLPKIAAGPFAGHPQIFGIAWAFVAHTDSRFDPATFIEFINAYQTVRPLTIGELWAAAISLRLVLIENLRRISLRTVVSMRMRHTADASAEQLLDGKPHLDDLDGLFVNERHETARLSFVVQLIKRLRDQESVDPALLDWLRSRVTSLGHDFETAVADEHARQATATVTMQNLITSLRFIADYHWDDWFDRVSLVDRLLRTSDQYSDMDFQTRNNYRNGIEDLARHSEFSELEVARRVIAAARGAQGNGPAASESAGYHIVGPGRAAFEHSIDYRKPPSRRIASAVRRSGLTGYLGMAVLFSLAILWFGLSPLLDGGGHPGALVALAVLGFLISFEAGLAMVNFAITQLFRPVVLPGLDLLEGIPEDLRTLVVVPALLHSHTEIEELCERLEVHFLANPRGAVSFALLTDWMDADREQVEDDQDLLLAVLDHIATLNKRHGADRFLVLHRRRQWNAQQGMWMGWERKRGKLHELNRLLRGAEDTSFMVIGGRLAGQVRFVLTLDADTRLPRDTLRRLVGKIAHPLNLPHFDEAQERVVRGYGILQPRVTASLPVGHSGSLFQRLYSTHRGVDPYVFAVSDVYQDFFGEGSFTGKGIYDVDAFEGALAGRVPDNSMLSHDLFEGNFARAALVSDVEVIEEYPERYRVAAARQHRWARGDWQLLPWIFGKGPQEARRRSPETPLGRWKMFDNLRRSLLPGITLAALVLSWLALPGHQPAVWTSFVIVSAFIPVFLPVFGGSSLGNSGVTAASQLRLMAADTLQAMMVTASNILLLAHQAALQTDAITRSLYRLFVSRRHLLEWTTAAQVAANSEEGLTASYRTMWASVAVGLGVCAIAWLRGNGPAISALPFAFGWLVVPAVAHWMSRPVALLDELLAAPEDRLLLRTTARRTWRFFEAFVGPDDNHLPPDNFQEDPRPTVAHRTSPTNIGLYLLSVACARQFGWISLDTAMERMEATLATIHKLEKVRGHLLNWYDTQTLTPLEPRYVSSVDSGNLAGHLIALANMCRTWAAPAPPDSSRLDGIADVLAILSEELSELSAGGRERQKRLSQLEQQIASFRKLINTARLSPEMMTARLITLAMQARTISDAVVIAARDCNAVKGENLRHWASALRETVEQQFEDASGDTLASAEQHARLTRIAKDAEGLALAMQFTFLSDPQRNLMSIGYRVAEGALDENCYDLLASEAALASFLAIAKGDLPARHWFRLGRPVTAIDGHPALVSWSGSMFEYVMPALVLNAPAGSLIDQTTRLVVQRQIEYGRALGIPWGISESAFSARDRDLTYQYSNFGVPGLGLKRGLAANVVVAPYATGLAAMIAPRAAASNFRALNLNGARGSYGFFEALDYTPSRLREGETSSVVKAYFAHHQGMTVTAILNAVSGGFVRRCFHEENIVRASELLLQERAPREVPLTLTGIASTPADIRSEVVAIAPRSVDPRLSGTMDVQFLCNGQFSTMMTATGTGYATWKGIALTRWREDAVLDAWGQFVFIRDMRTGGLWPAGYSPTIEEPLDYAAEFSEDKVTVRRNDGVFITTVDCVVSTESDAEARRVTVANTSSRSQVIEITTYAELALAQAAADAAHPVFSKLFVITEFDKDLGALLATRRRRAASDPEIWVAQFPVLARGDGSTIEFETSRGDFLGQGRTLSTARALQKGRALGGHTGTVLDPIFSLRQRLRLPAGQQIHWTLWTVVAPSREAVLNLVDNHRQAAAFDRACVLAWTHARVQLRHFGIEPSEAEVFRRLAGHLVFASPAARPPSHVLLENMREQTKLWASGVSGVRPILLVRIDAVEDLDLVKQLLRAHGYFSAKRLPVDLVILNDRRSSYIQDLQGAIEDLVRKAQVASAVNADESAGQVFALRADLLPADTVAMLPAVARVSLLARAGGLALQLARMRVAPDDSPVAQPRGDAHPRPLDGNNGSSKADGNALTFFNGYGGFDEARGEYVIHHDARNPLPAPWINVIANEAFGTHCAADGGGYTWCGNSREGQISPWANDPVSNAPGEIIYVRNLRTGVLISPCLKPVPSPAGTFRTRHGFGYTVHEARHADLSMELTQFVPVTGTIKISRLRITTSSRQPMSLAVTFYADLVLGASRGMTAPFLSTVVDHQSGALFVRNKWTPEFGDQVVFADLCGRQTSMSGDRRDFIGAFGTIADPAALARDDGLPRRFGAGFDPCAALQQLVTVSADKAAEVVVLFGAAANEDAARALVQLFRQKDIDHSLSEVKAFWGDTLGHVQVETPDATMNVMLNGWLLYQTLSCRMWGRSGFYQSSGAFGFRDQLQDSMAVAVVRPDITRAHLLRAAARQFPEGDVQHWWLPATGAGTRTRISDDPVWLSYCALHYVRITGDHGLFDEVLPFLDDRKLEAGEHDAYFQPSVSERTASFYEHCCLGLKRTLRTGPHGLPLIGGGDWNDGFNRVGENGQGESVWLAWFLLATLQEFVAVSERRGDPVHAKLWRSSIKQLTQALETAGWDGSWYRRGYFDDGTPLGSVANSECRIDAIAQSWAVLSGAANAKRAAQALDEASRQLVKRDERLALLFTPPFDVSEPDPGYVRAYPPGVRENGGQYTHGAIWSVFAHARLGDGDRAFELFALMNPVNHARTADEVQRYKVEPYVIAADVYSVEPHAGRGGWTWYTGAAGWMYRAGLEAILGVTREGERLRFKPCIPADWNGFRVRIRHRSTLYDLLLTRDEGAGEDHELVKRVGRAEWLVTLRDMPCQQTLTLTMRS